MSPFLEGFLSIFDIFKPYEPPKIKSDEEAQIENEKALRSDWERVGKDFEQAIKTIRKDQDEH